MKQEDFFAELDAAQPQEPDLDKEDRPFLTADLGVGAKQIIFWPPKGHEKKELSFNQLVTLMKEYETIPLGVGNEMAFVGWDEARIFFGNRLDQFLIDHFSIFPTDIEEKKNAEPR